MNNSVEKWVLFYEPFFPAKDKARKFVDELEILCKNDKPHPAKVMMHQTQRLVTLADDIPVIRKNNETLPLLFLLVCAEHIAKLHDNYSDEGQSRVYVRQFFDEFLSDSDKKLIETGISMNDGRHLNLRDSVDILYSVRCDLVHEGRYWGFHFHDGKTCILGSDPNVIVTISLSDLRCVIVRGCINAIQNYSKQP